MKEKIFDNNEEFLDEDEIERHELLEYDYYVDFYYTNLVNSLILFTYNSAELKKLETVLIDPKNPMYSSRVTERNGNQYQNIPQGIS